MQKIITMEPTSHLIIDATKKSPRIDFNASTGILQITGRCLPDDNHNFFAPALDWANDYVSHPGTTTILIIHLEYLQTGASIKVLELIRKLMPLKDNGKELIIRWGYEAEDEDMLSTGTDISSIVKFPFTFEVFGN